MSRAACVTSCVAPGGAVSIGGLSLAPTSTGSDGVPPLSDSEAMPVRPWNSRPISVSERTATDLSTEMVAITCFGLLRIELEVGHLADPDAVEQHRGAGAQAGHRAVELHAVEGALAGAADVLEPVDEAEHADRSRPA